MRLLCWDHPRCIAPVAQAARRWPGRADSPVTWQVRPLTAFNDQPLTETVAGFDLVFVDHPLIPAAARSGALLPLDGLVDASTLAALDADSVASSHRTYAHGGSQWAFAVDAACQVAAFDRRRLTRHVASPPRTWDELLELARRGRVVGLPLHHTDLVLACMSLTHGCPDADPVEPVSRAAIERLWELVPRLHPASRHANPPQLLDAMADPGSDAPAYVPWVFGYASYQRLDAPGRRLSFGAGPAPTGEPGGSVLGGVGLAVSAHAADPAAAARFAAWFAGAAAQRDVVTRFGGQPAARSVYHDRGSDALLGGFLSGTRDALEASWTRPARTWWPQYQLEAGAALADMLADGAAAAATHRRISEIFRRHEDDDT